MAKLLDQYGNPFERDEIQELQTAQSAHLYREFSDHPAAGITPAKLARLLTDAEQGNLVAQADLAADMVERDAHLFSELSKRQRAVLSLPWSIKPPRNPSASEKREAAELTERIEDLDAIESLLISLGDALLHGYSHTEMVWRFDQDWIPAFQHRPASWFTVAPDNQDVLLLRNQSIAYGEPLRTLNWIQHRHKSLSGYVARSGLVRVLVWPWLFKNFSVRDLADFLHLYGLPIGLGKYPGGASEIEKSTLLRALVNLGRNARGIIPAGMDIEFLDAVEGRSDVFEAMINWCERSQSKAILGGTLTSDSSAGTNTNALGNVHERAFRNLVISDAQQYAATLSRDFVYPLRLLNSAQFDPRRPMRFEFDTSEPGALDEFSLSVKTLVDAGAASEIPLSWLHERSGIPTPVAGEKTLADVLFGGQSGNGQSGAALAALKAEQNVADADLLDAFADDLAADWEQVAGPMLNPVFKMMEDYLSQGKSLEDFQRDLPQAVRKMNVEPMAKKLSQAMFVAQLAGRVDAE